MGKVFLLPVRLLLRRASGGVSDFTRTLRAVAKTGVDYRGYLPPHFF